MATPPSDDKHRLILESARKLLIKRGFQDIVLDDVAKGAGVAKGTLFLYYKSKDEMLSAAFADLVDEIGDALEALPGSGKQGIDLLTETVRILLDYFERNKDFLSQFGAGRFPGCGKRSADKLMEKFRLNLDRMVRILELCASQGMPRPADIGLSASVLFGLCRSAMFNRVVTEAGEPLSARAPQVVQMFLYGIAGPR